MKKSLVKKGAHPNQGEKLRILVVDDDECIRKLIMSYCTSYFKDYAIRDACDGDEALQIFFSFKPQLLITDNQMPNLHGVDLIRKIMEKHLPKPYIVMHTLDKLKDEDLDLVDRYLPKNSISNFYDTLINTFTPDGDFI